jgi:hypothetical protein
MTMRPEYFPVLTGEALRTALDRFASAILRRPDLIRAVTDRTALRPHHLSLEHRAAWEAAEAGRVRELVAANAPESRLFRVGAELTETQIIALARQIEANMRGRLQWR